MILNKNKKQGLRLMIGGGLILILCLVFYIFIPIGGAENVTLEVGERVYVLKKLVTEEQRVHGLSGQESLSADEGLLFVFEEALTSGFWMKDMNFPISIIWLDRECSVTGFKGSATPESYPEVFYPELPSFYVVEVNPLSIELKVGQKLECNFL